MLETTGAAMPSRKRSRARERDRILSLTNAMRSESAVEAGALGFMAKFLVQTTLPHRAHSGMTVCPDGWQFDTFHHRCRRHRVALWQLPATDFDMDDHGGGANAESRA